MQTTHNGRSYQLTEITDALPNLRANLKARGWDGTIYQGVSEPTGRQRKAFTSLFYRSAKSGSFVVAL